MVLLIVMPRVIGFLCIMKIDIIAFNKNPILFDRDPSFIYRCHNLAQRLNEISISSTSNHYKKIQIKEDVLAVILHRPRFNLRFRYLLHKLRKNNALIIADLDDFVFDVSYAKYSPAVSHGIISLRKVEKSFKSIFNALSHVDIITVSTLPLLNRVKSLYPSAQIYMIPNCVHYSWVGSGLLPVEINSREKVITYSPGTRSHDYDFAGIQEPIESFLADHSDVKLKITGPFGVKIRARQDQVIYQDKQPFSEYMHTVRSSWVNLMPLEQTPFNECKSALKAIEAGYWGIPTICSPNTDVERLTHAGAIIARDKQEWREVLERMLCDEEYARIATGLRERTLAVADIYKQAQIYKKEVLGLVD